MWNSGKTDENTHTKLEILIYKYFKTTYSRILKEPYYILIPSNLFNAEYQYPSLSIFKVSLKLN